MKKNISYIPMDSTLEIWLLEKLIKEPPKSDCVEDFLSGIRDMISGEVSSLILGASENRAICQCSVGWDYNWRIGNSSEKQKGSAERFRNQPDSKRV